jgi:hypothetical protein
MSILRDPVREHIDQTVFHFQQEQWRCRRTPRSDPSVILAAKNDPSAAFGNLVILHDPTS